MKDPYSVIGVSRNTSDEDIKKAYRELAKKYHPDNYVNNPLADLAQEKMKEINEAYDAILKERSGHSTSYSGQSNSGGAYSYGNSTPNNRIRQMIMNNNIHQAEQELNSISTRDAEWHFLMGSVMVRKGWYDEAKRHFQTACSMDPANSEYRTALNQMVGAAGGVYQSSMGGMNACDCCTSLMCANMMCDCCGGF